VRRKGAALTHLPLIVLLVAVAFGALGLTITTGSLDQTKSASLTVVALGCDVVLSSNETSTGYTIGNMQITNNIVSFPVDSNVTVVAQVPSGHYIASWYNSGGAVPGRTFGNSIWLILNSNGFVGVSCALNSTLTK
jgi:hypothetical protein